MGRITTDLPELGAIPIGNASATIAVGTNTIANPGTKNHVHPPQQKLFDCSETLI